MTRPAILDLDLVVVPREATMEMAIEAGKKVPIPPSWTWETMLSASPYPTAWDDVRKYVEGLERERDEATGTLRYCEKQWSDERGVMIDKFVYERNRAEAAEVRAEEAERQLSEISGHMDSECDSDSILHVVREAEADRDIYKDRAEVAEARITELEAALDEKEVAAGLTSNGNLWRFWSTKASALAVRNAELEKRLADAERVMSPFIRHYEPWMDRWPDDEESSTFPRHTFGQLRAARAYMEGK